MRNRSVQRAFTLVELLVVIAIIGILLGTSGLLVTVTRGVRNDFTFKLLSK